MIDLEFSKYHDTRDTIYGPYRCTCARGHKCPACTDHPTGQTFAHAEARRATILAREEGPSLSPGQSPGQARRAVRSVGERQAQLRAFMVRWLAAHDQFPLPGEMQTHSQARPRADWAHSPTMVYYAYTNFGEWYDDCLAHGIGTPLKKQQAAQRLTRLRGDAARRRHKREP